MKKIRIFIFLYKVGDGRKKLIKTGSKEGQNHFKRMLELFEYTILKEMLGGLSCFLGLGYRIGHNKIDTIM